MTMTLSVMDLRLKLTVKGIKPMVDLEKGNKDLDRIMRLHAVEKDIERNKEFYSYGTFVR